jgi:hypothetical protein
MDKVKARACLKNKLKAKGPGGVAQVVERLPSKLKALGSISILSKKKKKKVRKAILIK